MSGGVIGVEARSERSTCVGGCLVYVMSINLAEVLGQTGNLSLRIMAGGFCSTRQVDLFAIPKQLVNAQFWKERKGTLTVVTTEHKVYHRTSVTNYLFVCVCVCVCGCLQTLDSGTASHRLQILCTCHEARL